MVYIKANNEIIKVYQSVITSKKERVEWNGDIVIRKNAMILVGRLRSMYTSHKHNKYDVISFRKMGSNKGN